MSSASRVAAARLQRSQARSNSPSTTSSSSHGGSGGEDLRSEQFSAFVGSNLPLLVADPSSTLQLASQQCAASHVYEAWEEVKPRDERSSRVVDYLNRPHGLPPLKLTLQVGTVSACALDTDGDRVGLGNQDGYVTTLSLHAKGAQLWKQLHRPQNPPGSGNVCTDISTAVKALQFYVDPLSGRKALASAADICVRLWDVDGGGTELGRLAGHVHVANPGGGQEGVAPEGPCQCKHYLLDGKWRKERRGYCTLEGHSTTIADIALSPDAELLASSDTHDCGGVIKLWGVRHTRQLHALFGHVAHDCAGVAFGRDGCSLLSIGNDGCVLMWRWTPLAAGDGAHRFADGGIDVTPPELVGSIKLPWSNGECLALSPDGMLMAAACTPTMTSNAVLAVYELARMTPPIDAAVVDAVTIALARGADAVRARESRPEFGARIELGRCLRRDGHLKVATRLHNESAGVDEKTGEPKPPPYSDRLRAAFDLSILDLSAGDGSSAGGSSPPVVQSISEFDQSPYWPQAVRVTEKGGEGVLATYSDPIVHRMRSHVTRGGDKAGPPPCTCKSDWGELVPDPNCAVNGHRGRVDAVQYTPDGRALVSSGRSEVMLWDAQTHAPLATLERPHDDKLRGARCSADELVTWGGPGQLKVWDIEQVLRAAHGTAHLPPGHAQPITGLVACSRTRTVLSCSKDLTVAAWEAGGGEHSRMRGHEKPVRSCAISADGALAASGSEDRRVRIFRTDGGSLLHTWRHPGRTSDNGVSSVVWDPRSAGDDDDEPLLLVSANGEGNAIAFWRVPPANAPCEPPRLSPPSAAQGGGSGSGEDGEKLLRLVQKLQALLDEHGVVHLAASFDETDDKYTKAVYRPELQAAFAVAVVDEATGAPAPATAVAANGGAWVERTVVVTLRETGEELCRVPHPLRLCLQGHESHDDGCLCHWARFGKRPAGNCALPGHSWEVDSLAFASDGLLASSSRDATIRLWEVGARGVSCVATLEGFGESCASSLLIAWAPSGGLLASGGSSPKDSGTPQVLGLWETSARALGERRSAVAGAEEDVGELARLFGKLAHLGGGGAAAMPITCKELALPDRSVVADLCWSNDGGTLAVAACASSSSANKESAVVLFSASGRQKQRWVTSGGAEPKNDELRAIVFVGSEPGGRFIASVGGGGTCRVWRTIDGACLRAFHAGAPLTHVVSYQDGADCRLACGGQSGAVCLLRVELPAGFEPEAEAAEHLPDGAREASALLEKGKAEGVFVGLERVLASGASNGDVLGAIEALCMAVAGRALEAADRSDGECVVCMSAPRSVRFACGHCICCAACAERWRATGGGCPACRARLVVVQREVPEGASAYER